MLFSYDFVLHLKKQCTHVSVILHTLLLVLLLLLNPAVQPPQDQLLTLARIPERSHHTHTRGFWTLERAYDHVSWGCFVRVSVGTWATRAVDTSHSVLVQPEWKMCPLVQQEVEHVLSGHPLSPILFVVSTCRTSWCSQRLKYACGPQDCISTFCWWRHSLSFSELWPPACTGVVCVTAKCEVLGSPPDFEVLLLSQLKCFKNLGFLQKIRAQLFLTVHGTNTQVFNGGNQPI